MKPLLVVKVGGSLFDLPDLRERLRAFIKQHAGYRIVFVPGGGGGADVIRKLDRLHDVGEEPSHWLALRVLFVNAHFLAELLQAPVVSTPSTGEELSVLDPFAFCEEDEVNIDHLEHSWQHTSDSIAARVAIVAKSSLVLLKSTELPEGMSWESVGQRGLVDPAFAGIVERKKLDVNWINLRSAEYLGSR